MQSLARAVLWGVAVGDHGECHGLRGTESVLGTGAGAAYASARGHVRWGGTKQGGGVGSAVGAMPRVGRRAWPRVRTACADSKAEEGYRAGTARFGAACGG